VAANKPALDRRRERRNRTSSRVTVGILQRRGPGPRPRRWSMCRWRLPARQPWRRKRG